MHYGHLLYNAQRSLYLWLYALHAIRIHDQILSLKGLHRGWRGLIETPYSVENGLKR